MSSKLHSKVNSQVIVRLKTFRISIKNSSSLLERTEGVPPPT